MTDTAVIFNILAKDNASKTMDHVGKAALSMFSAFAAGQGLEFAGDAIKSASDLNESMSKAQVIFGKGTAAVVAFGDSAANSFGISKQEAIESAATFGNFFEAMGIGQDKASGMSTSMVKLASDLASFNNANPTDVLEALRSGLSGEVEPLRKFGVDLSDVTLKQEALREGMVIHNGTLTASQKAQAAYSLILAQTKTAQGDFSRTSGGLANQQRILKAEFENAKASLGAGLLPIMLKLISALSVTVGWIQKNKSWLTPLAIGFGILAAGIWLVTTAQTAWNIAMSLNPVGLIIIAIVALVAAIVYLWTHSSAFRNFFIGLWNAIWGFLKGIGHWFAHDFVDFFVNAYHWIQNKAAEQHKWIMDKWHELIGFVTSIPGKIRSAASGMWDGIKDAFKSAVNWLIGKWNGLHLSIPGIDFLGFHAPGFTLHVPQIPYLASGGTITSSGLAMVGEKGAEVVSLPTGTSVYPHGMAPGGSLVMRLSGNTEGAFATWLKQLIRSGAITFYDSTGQRVTVT